MAIDTAAKRKSCIGIGLGFLRTGIIPDASNLGASQRLHTQGFYSGIAAIGLVTITIIADRRVFKLDTDRRVFKLDTDRRVFTTH